MQEHYKEFVIWGIAPNRKYEEPLFTKARTMTEAKNVLSLLEKEHGCKACRIQVIDFKEPPDFTKTLNL